LTTISSLGLSNENSLEATVHEQTDENLRVYATSPTRVDEDAGQEMNLAHGGYGKRQLLELVQNGADAMISSPGGRIEVILTADYLYCANEGDPVTENGIRSLLHAHLSDKRGAEIGRFGLGFKSVLGVTSNPGFYSRPVSFGFDAAWSLDQISCVAPDRERYPTLRLAQLIDIGEACSADPLLTELMAYATTVVRLPRSVGGSSWLSDDIKNFDPAFMLFSPHVGELILSDRTADVHREIKVSQVNDEVIIREGHESRRWRVFSSSVRPSKQAKHEAWELSAREELPVVWAVPQEGRITVGQFWAFFPLRDETTLTGIANAPWQINDDRVGLLAGSQLNKELLDELARLVLESVPTLVRERDPGWILDLIPARGREARCWGDDYLTSRFYQLAASYPLIPDQDGRLRRASGLRLPPAEASRSALEAWASSPRRPANWCHASAMTTPTRRSRVERLFESAGTASDSPSRWIESLVTAGHANVEDYAHAIRTAAVFIREPGSDGEASRRSSVHRAQIVLDESGLPRFPLPSKIFIPATRHQRSNLLRLVNGDLMAQPGVREALDVIGIEQATPSLELTAFIREGLRSGSAGAWDAFWALVRGFADVNDALSIITEEFGNGAAAVRTLSGHYRPLSRTLLPGRVVPWDGTRDREVAIDVAFHDQDLEILRLLGAGQAPTEGFPILKDRVVDAYREHCVNLYTRSLPPGSKRPQEARMMFERKTHVGPLEPLQYLSEEGRAAFTEELVKVTSDWRTWTLKHETQMAYRPMQFAPAAVWAIQKEGRLRTSNGIRRVEGTWGPAFQRWSEIASVVEWLANEVAVHLGIPQAVEELRPENWQGAFGNLQSSTNDAVIGDFYAFAAQAAIAAPLRIRCRIGPTHEMRPHTAVAVTHDRAAFSALRDLEGPALLVSTADDSRILVETWKLIPASSLVRQETQWVESGAAATLADAFPTLRADLEDSEMADLEIAPCADIFEVLATERGTQVISKDFVKSGNRFLWKPELGLEEALRRISEHLPFELSDDEIVDLAQGRWEQERRNKLAAIRDQASNEDRLLKALGEERLKARLPVGLYDAVTQIHGDLGPRDVARLMLTVLGDDTLRYLRDDLREVGLEPPDRWAGSRIALTFVRDLGFPDEFAGAPSERRDPELLVPGPPNLPTLHEYQEKIVHQIHALLFGGEEHPRGLISLPTGAGKTRVAIQALVRALCTGRMGSPVLWIAPSDELCEQAVQTWSEVWRAFGPMKELRIGRLWGTNEVPEAVGSYQVVVATADKLRYRVDSEDYKWLSEATCVVIDEAHGATTPEYTKILQWLDISARGRSRTTRAPLLGLTATPFRGTSEEETRRLINRFGGRRLDKVFGGDDDDYGAIYRELQEMGVLSHVDGEELETGTTIDIDRDLSQDERNSFQRLGLPSLPSRVYETIAKDVDRNRLLLASILGKPEEWSILLFAVSTEHAHTMAALLTLEGISAAAIDYRTEPAIRRRYVDRFRHGDLRVLANYGVLTQGFDAPGTNAIYVARPTFSPNVYQQMIGRGLRGPLNGGKERCLIVNVRDNWITYGDKLAFYEFEHLWKPDEAS
jgi:superfamily II DNA or RNA helicase